MLSAVEYAGVDENGTKIMGLASATAVDAYFKWPIPNEWSFEEAVTVPFTYCLVVKKIFNSS